MAIVEAVLATGAGLFVGYASPSRIGIASPYLFSLLVLAFAQEAGAFSKVLKTRVMVSVGLLSYSIYMLQYVIQTLFYHAAPVFGYVLKQSDPIRGFRQGREVRLLPVTIVQGDLMIIVIMVCIVTASVLTRRWVELAANGWIRGLADRQWPGCTD